MTSGANGQAFCECQCLWELVTWVQKRDVPQVRCSMVTGKDAAGTLHAGGRGVRQ